MQHVNALRWAALMAPCARIVLSNAFYKPTSSNHTGGLILLRSRWRIKTLFSIAATALPYFGEMPLVIRCRGLIDKGERVTQHGIPNKKRRRGGMSASDSRIWDPNEAQWPTEERLIRKTSESSGMGGSLFAFQFDLMTNTTLKIRMDEDGRKIGLMKPLKRKINTGTVWFCLAVRATLLHVTVPVLLSTWAFFLGLQGPFIHPIPSFSFFPTFPEAEIPHRSHSNVRLSHGAPFLILTQHQSETPAPHICQTHRSVGEHLLYHWDDEKELKKKCGS